MNEISQVKFLIEMRKIRYLIVHHSLSAWGDGEVIRQWHTKKKPQGNGWDFPGYHVVICNPFPNYNSYSQRKPAISADGRVDRILGEEFVANGVKHGNSDALHVCLIGDFDKDFPHKRQLEKLYDLLVFWCKKYSLEPHEAIRGHGERQKEIGKESYRKTCPGKNINMGAIRALVSDMQNTKAPKGPKGEVK